MTLPQIELIPQNSRVYYINLGSESRWEQRCLDNKEVRIGFAGASDEDCKQEKWALVQAQMENQRRKWRAENPKNTAQENPKKAAKDDVRQLRIFYTEEGPFITLVNGKLLWCRPNLQVFSDGDSRFRKGKWNDRSLTTKTVLKEKDLISNRLRKLKYYKGTICNVEKPDYVIRLING